MSRLDVYLVENSLAPSRSKAQEMIQNGGVEVSSQSRSQVIKKASFQVNSKNKVRLTQTDLLKYVARSGLKLEHAINQLGINPKSKRVLDIGLSTGGFAHCLLTHGASYIVGVDVGRGQLHPQLQNHPQLISLEGVNARNLRESLGQLIDSKDLTTKVSEEGGQALMMEKRFDLITVDVSFISLEHILPEISHFLAERGEFLILVKPQFEMGRRAKVSLGEAKRKVVKTSLEEIASPLVSSPTHPLPIFNSPVHEGVKTRIINLCQLSHLEVKSCIPSQPTGRDGNKEFFIYGKKANEKSV